MATNKRGIEIKEYPKLVKTEIGKVLVKSKAEEAALTPKPEGEPEKKFEKAAWGKKSKDEA